MSSQHCFSEGSFALDPASWKFEARFAKVIFSTELASFFSRARARACPPAPVKPRLRQKASTPAPSHIRGKKAADEGKGGGSGFVEEGAMLLLGRIFWGGGSAGTRESLFATDQEID